MTRPEVEVRHGYSLDHLQALARLCATRAFSGTLGPFDRADIAWCARGGWES